MNRTIRSLAILGLLAATISFSGCGLLNLAVPVAAAKLRFGCIPEGTPVDTPSGARPIQSLRAGDLVIGFGGEPVRILQKHEYAVAPGHADFLLLQFCTGERVGLSGMHRIDGIPAADLHPGDVIAKRTVWMVTPTAGVRRSYDLITEDAGYRIAGLPVNSMIEEMLNATR